MAFFDTIYLACDILESIRQYMICTTIHTYAFPYFLYPLQNIAMVASIYTTVIVALERYVAVSRPIDVYISTGDSVMGTRGARAKGKRFLKGWGKVMAYVGPVVLFSIVFNITTFMEFKVKESEGSGKNKD